jgi:aspartyl-tRNA(Asn)/glutamyl-tRNA(Gln) amidotransferase subunit B
MRDVVNAGAVTLIEETVAAGATPAGARKWWMGEIARRANAEGQDLSTYAGQRGLTAAHLGELEGLVRTGRLNDAMARQVLEGVLAGEGSPVQVADSRGLELVQDDGALEAAVDRVIASNPDIAQKIRDGKVQAAGALIGQVMKELKGQADAARARELILARLGSSVRS